MIFGDFEVRTILICATLFVYSQEDRWRTLSGGAAAITECKAGENKGLVVNYSVSNMDFVAKKSLNPICFTCIFILSLLSPIQPPTKCQIQSEPPLLLPSYVVEEWPEECFCRTLGHNELDL